MTGGRSALRTLPKGRNSKLPAWPCSRLSRRCQRCGRASVGPLTACLCLLMIVMISSSAWWHTEIWTRRFRWMPSLSPSARRRARRSRRRRCAGPRHQGARRNAGQPRPGARTGRLACAGTVPQVSGLDSDMVAIALLDLHVLSRNTAFRLLDGATRGATCGRATRRWPPRRSLVPDTADAERIVGFLQRAQPESGLFQARYPARWQRGAGCGALSWMGSVGRCGQRRSWRPSCPE